MLHGAFSIDISIVFMLLLFDNGLN